MTAVLATVGNQPVILLTPSANLNMMNATNNNNNQVNDANKASQKISKAQKRIQELQNVPQHLTIMTNRPPIPISLDKDRDLLSPFQCLLRQQIEAFETSQEMVKKGAQGRNVPILVGQVGLRCRHCATLPIPVRPRGATYYSHTLDGVYQIW